MRKISVALLLIACGNPDEAAENCQEVTCPAGTAPALESDVENAFDLDAAVDPAAYQGELAFKAVGEGSCELICLTIEPCDENTFPVITEDCFTCGLVNPESGEVEQGSCG